MQIMDLVGEKKVLKKTSRPRVKQNRVVSMWNFEQPIYPIPLTKKFLEQSAQKQKKKFKTKKKYQFFKINTQIW